MKYCGNIGIISKEMSKMFNAFFDVNGEIKTLDQLGVPDEPAFEFLRTGTEDLEKFTKCSFYVRCAFCCIGIYYR